MATQTCLPINSAGRSHQIEGYIFDTREDAYEVVLVVHISVAFICQQQWGFRHDSLEQNVLGLITCPSFFKEQEASYNH